MADPDATAWRLVPRLLLRRAGFGFDMLESLADPTVARYAADYRRAVVEVDGARDRLLRDALPAAVRSARAGGDRATLRRISAVRSAVGRWRDLPAPAAGLDAVGQVRLAAVLATYRDAVSRCRVAERQLVATVGQDQADWGRRVRKELTPEVLDALLQLAPSAYDGVIRWLSGGGRPDTARDRAMLRRLYRFLQRLAAKNETTSSFGPLVHGVTEPRPDAPADLQRPSAGSTGAAALICDEVRLGPATPSGVHTTEPFVAFWAVAALARRMASDPGVRAQVPVSWVPVNRLDGDRLTLATGRVVRLTPGQARLAAAVDGRRTPTQLAAMTGAGYEDTDRELGRLERLGVVRCWPEPASAAARPFPDLLADARALAAGTAWPQRLERLREQLDRYAGQTHHEGRRAALAQVEGAFEDLAGVPARRAGGQMYADRAVVHLECDGDLAPVRIGQRLTARIEEELSAVLDLGAAYGQLRHAAHQSQVREVLRAAGVRHLPYDELVRRMQVVRPGAGAGEPAGVHELSARLTALVADRLVPDRNECLLRADELRALAPPPCGPRFASPDLLLRVPAQLRPDGAVREAASDAGDHSPVAFVLGEVHPYVFAWGSQRLFCPDPDGLDADLAADLACWGGRSAMAVLVPRRRHKGLIAEAFPGRFVELSAVATRDRDRALALTDLEVEDLGDRIALRDRHGEVTLYAGQDDHPHLLAFAPAPTEAFPLVRLGDTAPRVVVGGLVAQRAGWWIAAAELLEGRWEGRPGGRASGVAGNRPEGAVAGAGFLAMQRLRVRRGLPRWVYAHVSGEPKPVCIDLDAPLAVDTLLAMVATAPGETLLLREMLPEPGALWLRRLGRAHTSELRLAAVRRAG